MNMYKYILTVSACLVVAGCTSTSENTVAPSPTTAMMAAPATERSAFVGTWSGNLEGGSAVQIVIPANGNPNYLFDGQRVPVNSTNMSGESMVLSVGQGGGTITLTPAGDSLSLAYAFRGERSSAVLTRT